MVQMKNFIQQLVKKDFSPGELFRKDPPLIDDLKMFRNQKYLVKKDDKTVIIVADTYEGALEEALKINNISIKKWKKTKCF